MTNLVGQRVQAHPATDSWMMGDRYGTIVKVTHKQGSTYIHVNMDKSRKVKRFLADLVLPIVDNYTSRGAVLLQAAARGKEPITAVEN